jgi:serine/threonine protein kinase
VKVAESLKLFDAEGKLISLGNELGRGGEATVYTTKISSRAVKIYHKPSEEKTRKLELMISRPPADPTAKAGVNNTQHVSIAWPTGVVKDEAGDVVGFTMPLVNTTKAIPLHQLYNPKVRRQRAPGITWQYLVRIARNLSAVVTALHDKGYVIGDLNESNVLVTDRALVTLVDCDSVQARAGRTIYRCTVGKGEYTPPELQGKVFEKINRSKHHDAFGLSVLLFLLLMEGVHPFSGVYLPQGDPPGLLENIRTKQSPYLKSAKFKPMPIAPPFDTLPNSSQRLFKRALGARPRWRPTAKMWLRELESLEQNLVACHENSFHVYSDHLKICPWCKRSEFLAIEAFPASNSFYQESLRLPKSTPRLRGSFLEFVKLLPVITLLLVLLGSGAGYSLFRIVPLETFLPNIYARVAVISGMVALPCIFLIAIFYYKVKGSSLWYRGSRLAENILQASLGGLALALLVSAGTELMFGIGSVFKGDWSLLPGFWLLGFGVLWRYLRRVRHS